jgi:FKBP-type peptidyl-prolyl cis-trans isomerase
MIVTLQTLEIRHMPTTPAGRRLLGKSIALLALTALLAYGCERGKEQASEKPAPTPTAAKASEPPAAKTEPKPAPSVDAPKTEPAPKTTDAGKADEKKPDENAGPNAKPKPKPIPHTELAPDAKPMNEFVAPPGGVIVQEFKTGEGFPVLPKAKVTVHFVMYLKDGWKKLESTYDNGEPLTALLNEFVFGMGDGMIGMKAGGMRRIIVPPSRGFGEEGRKGINGGPDIPPNATLVFDVDLVSIQQTVLNPAPKPKPASDGQPDMNK